MNVVLILLTASLTIAIGFLAAFIWSVKDGQYEDDYTPSVRILFDEPVRKGQEGENSDTKDSGKAADRQPQSTPPATHTGNTNA